MDNVRKCKTCNNPAEINGVLCNTCRDESKIPITQEHKNRYRQRPEKGRYSNTYRNLTAEQIQALRKLQDGLCAICKRSGRLLVLDHDHKTNKTRGYLCRGCNTKLAGLDDTDFMGKARAYLDNPPTENI